MHPHVVTAPNTVPTRWWTPFLIAGACLGLFVAAFPGMVFIGLLVLFTAVALHAVSGVEERRFIATLFVAGFLVRALFSLALDAGAWAVEGGPARKIGPPKGWELGIVDRSRAYVRMGDSDYLSQRGYGTAQLAKGVREPMVTFSEQESYGRNGYTFVVGAFYYLFDFSPSAVKLLNCFFGALLGPLLFALTKAYFNQPQVAKWTSVWAEFFPSLIMWSASNLKEPSINALTVVLLWLALKIQQTGVFKLTSAWYAVLFAVVMFAHATLRSPVYPLLLLGSLVVAAMLLWCRNVLRWCWRKKWPLAILGLMIAAAFHLHPVDMRRPLAQIFYRHVGHVTTEGVSYAYLPEQFYRPGYVWEWAQTEPLNWHVLAWIGTAMWHYLLEPLPSRLDNLFSILIYPQILLWYGILLFALCGIRSALRWNCDGMLGLLLMLISWMFLAAVTGGNVGTIFRIRDMVTPFLLMLACLEVWVWIYGRPQPLATSHDVTRRASARGGVHERA